MIYWLIFVILEIVRNYVLIEVLELRPHYGWNRAIRFFAGFVWLIAMYPEFDPLGDYTTLWGAAKYGAFAGSSFYLLFDVSLNLLRKKPWNYRGKNSGLTDKLGLPYYYLLKIASLLVLVLSLIAIL